MAPFRELIRSKSRKFYWDDTLNHLFNETKPVIAREIEDGRKAFEVKRLTWLTTDYSRNGTGCFLFQKHCKCAREARPSRGKTYWKCILAGYRFTSYAELRYAPVEGEAVTLVYGLEPWQMFVLRCPDVLVTVNNKTVKKFSVKVLEKKKNTFIPASRIGPWCINSAKSIFLPNPVPQQTVPWGTLHYDHILVQ